MYSSIGPFRLGNAVTIPIAASLNPILPAAAASVNAVAICCPATPPYAANPDANTSIPATRSDLTVSLNRSMDDISNPFWSNN